MDPEARVQIPAPTLFIKKNARNTTIVTPLLVIKFPRDGKLSRVFKEFYLTWKAFLRGLSPPAILLGPFLLRPTVKVLLKHLPPSTVLDLAPCIERAIQQLSNAGIEHRELRHPENHVGFWRKRVVFLDFDHGRLTSRSRDLNKFRAWLEDLKKALGRA